MNAIVGFSTFLNDPLLIQEKREHFSDIITQSCNQLLSIIDDLVAIATIETGQVKIQEREINLNSILKLLHEQFNLKAQTQNVLLGFKTTLSDLEANIRTDETKVTEVLSNLLNNALKFTRQGYVNFGCHIKDNFLEFYVDDNGIGIPPEMHDEIFERFRQVEVSTSRKFGGSGLGLSISKAYIELLCGKIWLSSEPDKGSVFYFTIPYKPIVKDISPENQKNNQPAIVFEGNPTILVAEDEDSNYMLLKEFLADLKINMIRAVNGIEAVEICKSNPHIDLILMDIKMPDMDGYEATKRIREFRPDLPIIAQTAYTSQSDKNKVLEYGCNDFISKPIQKDLLLSKIKEQLAH